MSPEQKPSLFSVLNMSLKALRTGPGSRLPQEVLLWLLDSCNTVRSLSVTNGNSLKTLDNFALTVPSSTHEAQYAVGTSQMPRNQWVAGRSQMAELISAPSGLIQRRCRRKPKFSAEVQNWDDLLRKVPRLYKSKESPQLSRAQTAWSPPVTMTQEDLWGLEPQVSVVHGGPQAGSASPPQLERLRATSSRLSRLAVFWASRPSRDTYSLHAKSA